MSLKLEKIEGHENYVCTVVKLPPKQKVERLDKLVKVTVFGNDVLTQKDTDESQLYLFFPAECQISTDYLRENNEYRDPTLNFNKDQKGYFEPSGRVKTIKFKGVISTGYLAPIKTLVGVVDNLKDLDVGDEFNTINGHVLCKKYRPVHQQSTATKESRFNKKLKRFSKLVQNQFRFHVSTSHLAKNLHVFQPDDIIVITDKWHGTSGVFSNVLVKRKLNWLEKLLSYISGFVINDKEYGNIYSSRTVVKNEYINPDQQGGYYGEDIWAIVNKELKGKIEQGISLYGEIVGYLPSGKEIQKGYDYGCAPILPDNNTYKTNDGNIITNQHRFLVYRITYTKPDGNVIEFSWNQVKEYCKKYEIETVKELYFGKLSAYVDDWGPETFFDWLCANYLEKDCVHCVNKVPAEGIVVRRDGLDYFAAYKLKAKRFLERETKELDAGIVSIEDEVV